MRRELTEVEQLANPGIICQQEHLQDGSFWFNVIFVFLDVMDARHTRTDRLRAGAWYCIYCDRFDHETNPLQTRLRARY
ncbi:MAG: hypothetical protein QM270_00835 [Bacillota bacterium]|nr:hypothetical protein [Bacillota bacterium]